MIKHIFLLSVFVFSTLLCADVSQEKIASWIKKLGSDDFQTREQAMVELKKIGEPALPLLREAENHKDPEISWRAKSIIEHITDNYSQKETYSQEENDEQDAVDENYSVPFEEDFEYNLPGFRFKFKFSGQLGEEFSKLKKEFFQDDAFRHFPENWEKDIDSLQEELEKLFSDEQFPFFPKDEMDNFEKQWQTLQKRVLPDRGFIDGVKLNQVDEVIRVQLDLKEGQGLVVSDTTTGLLTAKGIEKWDLLLCINNTDIYSQDSFKKAWKKIVPGEKVTIDIIRKGKSKKIEFIK